MNTLTKRDLVTRISNETGAVQQQVLDVVQKTLDYIAEALARGDKVELRNFGVFEVKVRKARIGRNPNSPEGNARRSAEDRQQSRRFLSPAGVVFKLSFTAGRR